MPFLDTPARGVGHTVSGRLGSTIYAHGPFGPYAYTFTPRVDPNTPRQQQIRTFFATAAAIWKYFTPATRAEWDRYADNVRTPNAVGTSAPPTGYNRFVGTYTFVTLLYVTMAPTAPTVFTLGRCGMPTFQVFTGSFILVIFDPTDEWLHHSNAAFALFTSPPQPLTVNYFRGPYRLAGTRIGPVSGPPYQQVFRPAFFPYPRPCKIFLRGRAVEADNRLSPNVYGVLTFT